MAKTNILPDYIVLRKQVDAIVNEAVQMIESANTYLANLKSEGIPTDLAALKIICKSDEAFKDWLRKAELSYIGKLGFLPKEERTRIHKTFTDLEERTSSTRNSLNGFLFNSRGYEPIQEKDGKLTFDLSKIEADAELKARKTFTSEDKKYFALLQGVEEAFRKLQNFERTHQYIQYSSDTLFHGDLMCGFTPEWFTTSMRIGKMSATAIKMMEEMKDDE